MLDTDRLKEFAKLKLAQKKLKKKYDELGKKIDQMEPGLVRHMQDEEFDKVSLKGGITMSIDEKIWAKVIAEDEWGNPDKSRVVEALRQAKLFEYITAESFNSQSLSKYLRELVKAEEELPKELSDVIASNPVSKIKVTKPK